MMTLRGFCLVLSTVLLRHSATSSDNAVVDAHRELSMNLLVGTCVGFCVLAKVLAVASALRYPTVSMQQAWREFESRRGWLEWLWLPLIAWLLPASGYAQLLADAEQQGWPHALAILGWFAPSIVFLAVLELSATELELDLAQSIRPRPKNLPTHTARWWMRVRLGALGSVMMCMVPVMFVLGAMDILEWSVPHWSERVRSVLAVCMLAVGCLTLAPLWMKVWVGAKPLDDNDELTRRVELLCQQMKIRMPQLMTVGDGQSWHGAALVGWVAPFRQLWIGHSLRTELTERELDLVVLHELAHLRRGHSWLRLLPVLLCGVLLVLLLAQWDAWGTTLNNGSNDGFMDGLQAWGKLSLLPVAALCIAVIGLLTWLSHACELDADRDACIQASQWCSWAADQPGCAASVLLTALTKLHGRDASRQRWTWLHPSLERRTQSLHLHFSISPQTLPIASVD